MSHSLLKYSLLCCNLMLFHVSHPWFVVNATNSTTDAVNSPVNGSAAALSTHNLYSLSLLHNLSPKLLAKSNAYVEKLLFKKFKSFSPSSLPSVNFNPAGWRLPEKSINKTSTTEEQQGALVPLLTSRVAPFPLHLNKTSSNLTLSVEPRFVWWDSYEAAPKSRSAVPPQLEDKAPPEPNLAARQLMPIYGQTNNLYNGIDGSTNYDGGSGGLSCQPLYTGTVFESTPIGTFVLQVRAFSSNSGNNRFPSTSSITYSIQESAFGRFQINAQTGAITTANLLGRQTTDSINSYARSAVEFRVRATDSFSGQYCESTVRLNIIPQATLSGSTIGVQNFPPSSSSFGTYNTPPLPPAPYVPAAPPAYNSGGGGVAVYGSSNNNFDGNNQPPIFLQVSYSFTVTNCAPNAFVGSVQARDPDGDPISYSLLNSNSLFTIDPVTGQISMMTGFGSTYGGSVGVGLVMFRVLASDTRGAATQVNVFVNSQQCGNGGGGSGGDYYGSSSVNNYNTFPFVNPYNTNNGGGGTIGVYNTPPVYGGGNFNGNNQPPRFLQQSYTFSLFGCLPGTFVGGINAQDPDNDPITYSIVNDNGLFSINAVTGQLTTSLNFPSFSIGPNVYVFQAFASDARGGSTQVTITVTTTQCNGGGGGAYGAPSYITPAYVPPVPYGTVSTTYNNNNSPYINNNNAYGGGGNFRFLQSSYIFGDTIQQQCFPNTQLGTVSTQGGAFPVTYKLVQPTTSSSTVYGGGNFLLSDFVIDYTTGIIRVGASTLQNGPIDRTFIVTATDANGRLASATVRVFCNSGNGGAYGNAVPAYPPVTPYGDNGGGNGGSSGPVFSSSSYTFPATCGLTPPTPVGRVIATPAAGSDVTFNVRGTSDFLVVDEGNFGRIQPVSTLTTAQTYTFTVEATDTYGRKSTASVTVKVTCDNNNGQGPKFTQSGPFSTSRSTPANTVIGTVTAVGVDGSSSTKIRYSTSSNDVEVNPLSGEVLTARLFASETGSTLTAIIFATDEQNRTTSVNVVINLINSSPNLPVIVPGTFPSGPIVLNAASGACLDQFKLVPGGRQIFTFRIKDNDTPSSRLNFVLSDTSNFVISGVTSPTAGEYEVRVTSRTTLFPSNTYNLKLTVIDPDGNQTVTPTVKITVSC